MTHTSALLEISPAAHAEIAQLLRAAGYDHAIDHDQIDMQGIALIAAPDAPADPVTRASINEWLQARLRAAGGEITDIVAFGEECVRWAERRHGITFDDERAETPPAAGAIDAPEMPLQTIDAILFQCDRGNVSLPWLIDALRGIKERAGPWCCEKGQAAGKPVCDECAAESQAYSAAMAPEPDDTPLETGEGDAR